MKIRFIALLLLFSPLAFAASRLSESAEVSLLTCSPGERIFELFGHSAIRVHDDSLRADLVFNYGVFSFFTENFVFKFVSGQTDYTMGIDEYAPFCVEYAARGSAVTETFLDLTQEEKQAIWDYLWWNADRNNSVYRYNFIFNNCATKIRDLVENAADSVSYAALSQEPLTFRQAIRLYTKTAEWSQFGFDLCLGAGTDRLATTRELTFLPQLMDEAFCTMSLHDAEGTRPLLDRHNTVVKATAVYHAAPVSPLMAMWGIFAIVLALSVLQYFYKWNLNWLDAILFGVAGLVGIVIFYLMAFSEHPFTTVNFNIVWLNPLMLISLFVYKLPSKFRFWYYAAIAASIALLLITAPFNPQCFNAAFYPIMLAQLLRALQNCYAILQCKLKTN